MGRIDPKRGGDRRLLIQGSESYESLARLLDPWLQLGIGVLPAVVGRADELKGQAVAAFVSLREGYEPRTELRDDLKQHVVEEIGAIARPADVIFTADRGGCTRTRQESEH